MVDNAFAFGELFATSPLERETAAVREFNEVMARSRRLAGEAGPEEGGGGGAGRAVARPATADEDGRPAPSRPARHELALARFVVAPLEVDPPLPEERHDDPEGFLEPAHAMVEG